MDTFGRELNGLLMTTYRSICILEEAMLKDYGQGNLSISEMHMIEAIGMELETGRSITDLAQEQNITLPSVTMCIKKLEKKGFVTKTRCAEDGRRVVVKLTRAGRRAEAAHRYFHRQMANAVKKNITPEEQAALLKALSLLNAFIEERAGISLAHAAAGRLKADQEEKEGSSL